MNWNIEFFDKTVEASIREWPENIMPEFLWQLNLIETMGPDHKNIPYITSLDDGLFQINTTNNNTIACALFCISKKDKTVILLDGFITPSHHIMNDETALARSRMNTLTPKER